MSIGRSKGLMVKSEYGVLMRSHVLSVIISALKVEIDEIGITPPSPHYLEYDWYGNAYVPRSQIRM